MQGGGLCLANSSETDCKVEGCAWQIVQRRICLNFFEINIPTVSGIVGRVRLVRVRFTYIRFL